jgi:hypothetical protein
LNMSTKKWLQRAWVLLLVCAVAAGWSSPFGNRREKSGAAGGWDGSRPRARLWPLLLLGIPVPFYALSVAYGGVPIYIPPWWPFTHYNVRYGLQLLPAFAVALGVVVAWAWEFAGQRISDRPLEGKNSPRRLLRRGPLIVVLALCVSSYASIWRSSPICLREAEDNMRGRIALESQVAKWLDALPSDSTLLMYVGGYPGALERAGIPFQRVINEGNHRVWKQPSDPEGLWEHALADPGKFADYAVAFQGDPVWQAVHSRHLQEVVEISVTGQPRAIIYRAR